MSIQTVKQIVCDKCGYTSDKTSIFRTFIGNVGIPMKGGLISDNILLDETAEHYMLSIGDKNSEETDYFDSVYKDGKAVLVIRQKDYCVDCVKNILKLNGLS